MAWFIASAVVAAVGFVLLCFYALATVSARAEANAEAAFRAMTHGTKWFPSHEPPPAHLAGPQKAPGFVYPQDDLT